MFLFYISKNILPIQLFFSGLVIKVIFFLFGYVFVLVFNAVWPEYTRKNITGYYRVVVRTCKTRFDTTTKFIVVTTLFNPVISSFSDNMFYHISTTYVVQRCSFIKPWTVCSNMHKQACQQPCSSWLAQPCSSWSAQPCLSLSTTLTSWCKRPPPSPPPHINHINYNSTGRTEKDGDLYNLTTIICEW